MKKRLSKNVKKLIITAALSMLFLCGCQSIEKKLVGKWAWIEAPKRTIEFFDNGSAETGGNTYQWVCSDDTLTLYPDDSLNNNTEIYNVEIDGDSLILSSDSFTFEYERID